MSKKLVVLDLALLALTVAVGLRLRSAWLEAEKRAGVIVGLPLKPAAAPPYSRIEPPPQAMASDYVEVAQQMLFSADRNPTVVVEVEAPPKPMPPLPVVYGVMNLGDGMLAMMGVTSGGAHKEIHPGQKIGEFKMVSVDREQIVLEWEGKTISRKPSELSAQTAPAPQAAQANSAPAPPPQQVVAAAANAGPGEDMGVGIKRCVQGDSSPAGTVVDGMKKVVTSSPFGPICRWESIK